ncbi:MAG: prepilin peptidase [Gemmatimonadetes bacterium]|nr:prepilin peptidase [Gemmatimonadota bacterium]
MMLLPDWYFVIVAGLFGAALGSFLNVCVYRWPADLSVISPRSRCGGCGQPIAWYDNIPVLSWLALRARCRHCGSRISPQYPLVELGVAGLWAIAAWQAGSLLEAVRVASFLTILLGIALTDARDMVIPDQFTIPGTALGICFAAFPGAPSVLTGAGGAVLGYLLLWAVKLAAEKALGKPALGVGDIHMMALVGAFTGPLGVLLTLLIGSVLGLVLGVPAMWVRGRLAPLQTYLPLGLFLALGAAVTVIWGPALVGWYVRTML